MPVIPVPEKATACFSSKIPQNIRESNLKIIGVNHSQL